METEDFLQSCVHPLPLAKRGFLYLPTSLPSPLSELSVASPTSIVSAEEYSYSVVSSPSSSQDGFDTPDEELVRMIESGFDVYPSVYTKSFSSSPTPQPIALYLLTCSTPLSLASYISTPPTSSDIASKTIAKLRRPLTPPPFSSFPRLSNLQGGHLYANILFNILPTFIESSGRVWPYLAME